MGNNITLIFVVIPIILFTLYLKCYDLAVDFNIWGFKNTQWSMPSGIKDIYINKYDAKILDLKMVRI